MLYIFTLQYQSKFGHTILMFLKEVSSAHQACIYLIKNTEKNSTIMKYYNLK